MNCDFLTWLKYLRGEIVLLQVEGRIYSYVKLKTGKPVTITFYPNHSSKMKTIYVIKISNSIPPVWLKEYDDKTVTQVTEKRFAKMFTSMAVDKVLGEIKIAHPGYNFAKEEAESFGV